MTDPAPAPGPDPLLWALAPAAFAASAVLWPWCVVTAYWCRTWSDHLNDAALALADPEGPDS